MTGSNDCSQLRIQLNDDLLAAMKKAIEEQKEVPESIKESLKDGTYVGIEEIQWLYKCKVSNIK